MSKITHPTYRPQKKTTVALTLLIILLLMTDFSLAQEKEKKIADSGRKPNWVTWSKGRDFKYITRGSKKLGIEKGPKYLFVATAKERAYQNQDGKASGYTLDDVKALAQMNASSSVASILRTTIDNAVANSTAISETDRERIFVRTNKMVNKASFSGFTQIASYWQKVVVEDGSVMLEVHQLYSINKEELSKLIQKVAAQLEIPETENGKILNNTLTETEVSDDDLGDF